MFWGKDKGRVSNAMSPNSEPESHVGVVAALRRKGRRWWFVAVFLGVIPAAFLAVTGSEVAVALGDAARRVVGGGTLYWSDETHGWTEIPLALRMRRHWGEADHVLQPGWEQVQPGLDMAELSFLRPPDPRGVDILLVRVDPARWQFRVYGRDDWSRGSVSALANEAGLAFAVNGPYFAEDGPLGLVVSDGVFRNRQGSRRAAHFLVDEPGTLPRIVNERGTDVTGVREGFQGFPSIMTGRKTYSYLRTGGRGFDVQVVDRRTAACTTASGEMIFLTTDTWIGGLSLSELATVMGALGCVDAMAFDGGASTGMWIDGKSEVRGLDEVPVIVGVIAVETAE